MFSMERTSVRSRTPLLPLRLKRRMRLRRTLSPRRCRTSAPPPISPTRSAVAYLFPFPSFPFLCSTAIAEAHGNEPSRGAVIDEQLRLEEEAELKAKGKA